MNSLRPANEKRTEKAETDGILITPEDFYYRKKYGADNTDSSPESIAYPGF